MPDRFVPRRPGGAAVVAALLTAALFTLKPPAAPASVEPVPAPARLDSQDGHTATVIGKLVADNYRKSSETWHVDGHKLRGVPREKLAPLRGQRVQVSGQFRVIFGEVVLYVSDIGPAPKDDPNR